MSNVSAKLRLKPGQTIALVGPVKKGEQVPAIALPSRAKLATTGGADVVVLFAARAAEVKASLAAATKQLAKGGVFWIAYPKAGQLDTDLNRDKLFALLSGSGWQAVTQIALDDVWSALRAKQGAARAAATKKATAPSKATKKKAATKKATKKR